MTNQGSVNKSKRQLLRESKRKQQVRRRVFITGGAILAVLVVIAVLLISANNTPVSAGLLGDEVAITSRDHIPNTQIPGPYNSNPPAGWS